LNPEQEGLLWRGPTASRKKLPRMGKMVAKEGKDRIKTELEMPLVG